MKSWTSRPVPELPGSMPQLRLYDTALGRVVDVERQPEQSMYVCGITPYDATHMGHAASYVAFDLLNRAWRDAGVRVSYVQNVTDIDDPLLERATATGVDWRELAQSQIDLFQTDMDALNVLAPNHYIGAVEAIPDIVPAIEQLIADGVAYRVAGSEGEPDGDVYYDVETAGKRSDATDAWTLGDVSGLGEKEMLELFAERGGDPTRAGKRHALDPLLWRVARDGEPSWPGSTLGDGRPGWHIECTVIAQKYLPAPFTVQGGGSDLVFPHHEMGAGHAYSLSGVPLARHYSHAGMVGLDGEKMSKSKGNLVLVSKLRAAGEEPAAIRLAILAHHYRSDWSWTDAEFAEAKDRLKQWRAALDHAPAGSAAALISAMRDELANDLNAPGAIAAVDHWAAEAIRSGSDKSEQDTALVTDAIDALLGVEL
ncbi:L-cysteine:1D-myo-inositol 2-amino-2-deoxy-alpha-D-glucopyranoside ligase [Pseudarthrobacter sp. PvP004]|uniref:L-cysteine:1D-myo-inositol 2-amino-2-deoxy-alpha-D-glucopyranoside ligase n=1 Tax=Paenarthrobacter aurescens (strain TC1) TaxID=290340 RepID=MSHC_PAEAT|nr:MULTISPECIES: cysteine--1-D-myo-inosityl 2-amino-2-deoxy-alpha-D-glucopyranoside ligase [Micrococcaceae]A1R6P9.1 RecName: Full=L-cysteine:1D-myo-inositol 2-amino-2-deoxy-alpha-D-glucopyranoside ligase; Short=L-Cys:GlcN-Ins ligase; AltName: Full=Mycothiol ligase; Short=MSH ligase [Paenarthrobacter aurescens TC1]ABM09780.1 putative cysteinyl-tRNA synthetase (cysS) [Paenarthrobacter aurescens TC1]MBP2265716.1 L-cysteine:1D-myo-inositol 2-amino-2-deoxy-alpha-D-glucopyranoside ligase [Pseudarthrob